MWLKRTSAPGSTAVSLDEAKRQLRVLTSDEDMAIGEYLDAAIAFCDGREGVLGRALITQSWEWRIHDFPAGGVIRLPLPPLQSVESIKYLDTGGVEQTLSTDIYNVESSTRDGVVWRAYSKTWPSVRNVPYAVRIAFTAGYGDDEVDVPGPIKQAIKLVLTHLYESRGVVDPNVMAAAVRTVAGPYKIEQA